jgi:hypothetical protein
VSLSSSWERSSNKSSFMQYIIMAVPAFMFPGMIALFLFMTAKRRSIMAFTAQQTIPVVQEGVEKVAPSMAKVAKEVGHEMAPLYGEVAKEISKGIKEGLKEDEVKETKKDK